MLQSFADAQHRIPGAEVVHVEHAEQVQGMQVVLVSFQDIEEVFFCLRNLPVCIS